jgi:flagellar protein FliO/FliZ
MEALFGGMPDAARFIVAFLVVLGLIGGGAYLWRRFGAGGLSPLGPRGRQPRLAVIDAANIDGRRRLVLIRRDNIEHLLMIGGPTDIVIEPGIVRAANTGNARDQRAGAELPMRSPTETTNWQALPFEPPPRVLRPMEPAEPAKLDPTSRPSPLFPERPDRSKQIENTVMAPPLTATPPEPSTRVPDTPLPLSPPEPPPPPVPAFEPVFQTASEPTAAAPPVVPAIVPPVAPPIREPVWQSPTAGEPRRSPPRPTQADENNLVEMAQRLEAALRRPNRPVEPASSRPVEAAPSPPLSPPAAPPGEPGVPDLALRVATRTEPPVAARVAPHFDPPIPPAPAVRPSAREPELTGNGQHPVAPPVAPAAMPPAPPLAPGARPASSYGSLEEEMASLLGRGPGKT